MNSQFELNDEQIAIQDMARKFTSDAILPHAAEWDEKHLFPSDTIKAAADLGFGAIYVSEESGGIGLGRLEAVLIMEAMAYGCPTTSAFISIHNMAAWMIDCFGRSMHIHDSIVDLASRYRVRDMDVLWPICRSCGANDAAKSSAV